MARESPFREAVLRPKALDLFCGAGGAAMGLHRAGFDVTGMVESLHSDSCDCGLAARLAEDQLRGQDD